MHLLSSPAHLFSMVLLSIALGVMTMAVPLTVRDTDIGEWQRHSKRLDDGHIVGLVRRFGQEQQSEAKKRRNAKSSKKLDGQESWYLYITRSHRFHAIQENQLQWRLKHVADDERPSPGLILGSIKYDVYSPSSKRLANLYSKLETITGDSQFEALNAMINFLKTDIPEGLEYTPRPEDPDAWTKIFLAMTDYDLYLHQFPYVPEKDRYKRPTGETTVEQAASISKGISQLPTTSGGQSAGKLEAQGYDGKPTQGKSVKEQMRVSNLLGPQKNNEQTQAMSSSTDPMRISNLLG